MTDHELARDLGFLEASIFGLESIVDVAADAGANLMAVPPWEVSRLAWFLSGAVALDLIAGTDLPVLAVLWSD